jgi:predicted enzyme related to lactoylglutathione lyase
VPLATYQDLCIDAVDAEGAARFWGGLLGLAPGPHRNGVWRLDDQSGRPAAWVNPVPEPKTVKNRVHLDVNAEGLDAALAAGATVVDDSFRWTVMRDPDGQEFCIFVRDTPIERRLYELVVDSGPGADECLAIARWWGEVLGAEVDQDEEGECWIENVPGAPFEGIVFGPVPEPKAVKNRVHIDVATDDLDALTGHGARVLRAKGDGGIGWTVLADPDGNEFCAFTPD